MPRRRRRSGRGRGRTRTGGITAPASAAGGPRTGVSSRWRARGHTGVGPGRAVSGPGAKKKSSSATPAAAAAPPGAAPTPWSMKAEAIVAGARKSYLNAQNDFNLAEQTAKQDFGLDPGFNDYKANPYSRAALLQQEFRRGNRGTTNSAGNQLYSGSVTNQLGYNRNQYSEGRDALTKAYRDALSEIRKGRAGAAEEKAEQEREAELARIEGAEKSELDSEQLERNDAKAAARRRRKRKRERRRKRRRHH